MHLIDAKFVRNALRRFYPVSGQHHAFPDSDLLHVRNRFFRSVFHRVGYHNAPDKRALPGNVDHRSRVLARLIENGIFLHQLFISDQYFSAVDPDTDSMTRDLLRIGHTVHINFVMICLPDRCGYRVVRITLAERSKL